MVMEFIDGETLTKKLEGTTGKKLDEEEAATLMHSLFRAINHCHSIGVIHRDIKLDNIMINNDNEIRVIDFGLSKACRRNTMTKMRAKVGTHAYMAPELKNEQKYTYKVDFWALGVVLHQLVVGLDP